MTASQETMTRTGAGAIEAAARTLLREGLLRGRSGFTRDREVWTAAHAKELMESYVSQPDISGSSFEAKLSKQFAHASDGAVQLFAELYYLSLLPLSDYKGKTKRSCIRFALDLGDPDVTIPTELDAPLDWGVFNGGVAFKTRRYFQLAFLVEFTQGFLQRSPQEREALLQDPIAFRDTVAAVTAVNAPSQQHGLEYLAFPTFFLPIAKVEHRKQIRNTFLDRIGESTGDEDRDLAKITEAIKAEVGGWFDYYKEPYRSRWDPKFSSAKAQETSVADPWTAVLHWATRLSVSVDLKSEERDYKVKMAQQISAAVELALMGDDRWADDLRKALNTNLLPTYFKVALFDDLKAKPAEFRSMLFEVWESKQSGPALDVMRARLKSLSASKQYTPGNAAALGSVLLMGRDLAEYPPYRPTPVLTLCRLTNSPPPGNAPSQRYDVLLGLCDELIERGGDTGLELQDRLDAQSLLWAVAQYPPPEGWSEAERDGFLAWRGDVPSEDETAQRAWLVRGSSVNGRDLIPTWLEKGSVSLAASKLREVAPGSSREQLKVIVDEDYAHASYADKASKVDEFHAFLTRMQPGDVVVTTSQGRMYVGTIEGPATYQKSDDERSNLRRDMNWVNRDGIDYSELPADIASRLQVQYEVVDMTRELDLLEPYMSGVGKPDVDEVIELPTRKLVLSDATDELADRLHVAKAWLQECIDLLRDRPQLIFYGPPGTGKTYIATHLAEHLAGDNVRLVQFHPAYSYEDFFEGYRPEPGGGFALKPGPMRKVVDKARDNPATLYFLIIDEINRGNLAKIFGELYFLLEYRDHNVDLLYATDDDVGFTLPRNVFIIGTMNTADRSIALVDAAMRRRFAFVPLHPAEPPTRDLLRRWLEANELPSLTAELLDELNRRIEDPDFKIGPSYFMRPAVHLSGGLERAWRTAIMPLLEEFHYGEGKDLDQAYGLDHVRAAVEESPVRAGQAMPDGADALGDSPTDDAGNDEAPGAD